jgi:hypothetical protein
LGFLYNNLPLKSAYDCTYVSPAGTYNLGLYCTYLDFLEGRTTTNSGQLRAGPSHARQHAHIESSQVSSFNTSCNEAKLRITGLWNFDDNTRKRLISRQLLVT